VSCPRFASISKSALLLYKISTVSSLIMVFKFLLEVPIFYVKFKGFKAVTMKNAVFWDVAPCGSCVNRRFGGMYRRLNLQPPAHAGSSLADFSTLKMEAIRSSETSVYTRSTRRHIPEDGILHYIFCYIYLICYCI
jgi:hypothetical protein